MAVVGLHGGECFGAAARQALAEATVLVGAPRHLEPLIGTGRVPAGIVTVDIGGNLAAILDRVAVEQDAGGHVCLAVSGDPGFFGLVRLARARLGPGRLRVHPAPSSVSLAFAAAGTSWDDAVVVSAHGRDPAGAIEAVRHHPKVAVLCSPATPPEEIGRLLSGPSAPVREVTVASLLGETGETVWTGDLTALAAGRFDPLSVVILIGPDRRDGAGWAWGLPESRFTHRAGMITKAEVRAVALGKLRLAPAGVMWDVGAGSGSVSAECAYLAPGLSIFAVERRTGDLPALRTNLEGTAVTVVEGEAPACLAGLPDPDRVFVGGGGLEVLESVIGRLRPGGTVVATYASPARAAVAAGRLGSMVQISVNRSVPAGPDGSIRLAAENPVFVCWGPQG